MPLLISKITNGHRVIGMNNEKGSIYRSLGLLSSMGISAVLAVAIGVWFGLTLDRWLGTHPWFFYIFLFIGIAAGFRNIYVIAGREINRNDGSNS